MACGTVGNIPDCLYVPTLVNDLLSVPYMDVAIGRRTTFAKEKCVVEDVNTRTVNCSGVLDRGIMLYVVPISHVEGSSIDTATLDSLETRKQAFSVMTKGDYVNKLHDIFHCHDRRLEALVRSGVVNRLFDANKDRRVILKMCHMPVELQILSESVTHERS